MKLDKSIIIDNIKTLFYALLIAIVIRSLFLQPFYIPSSSMEPTLLVGDRLFVTKYLWINIILSSILQKEYFLRT